MNKKKEDKIIKLYKNGMSLVEINFYADSNYNEIKRINQTYTNQFI